MFSIVIPLYNKALYIHKTINSVLNQTFKNFELIIVNDGSTDNSLEIINEYNDNRIKIINQNNSGVSSARNNGIKNAAYDLVAFLDADDWWDKNYLNELFNLIKKYPDAGLYGSNFYDVHKNKFSKSIKIPNFKEGYINYFKIYLKNMNSPIWSSACIINKKIINNYYFNEMLKGGEDLEYWIRIACHSKVAYLNECLSYYNHNEDENSTYNKIFNKENYYIFNIEHFNEYEKNNLLLKNLLDNLRVRSLKQYYVNNLYISDVKNILKSVNKNNITFIYKLFYFLPPNIAYKINYLYNKIKC